MKARTLGLAALVLFLVFAWLLRRQDSRATSGPPMPEAHVPGTSAHETRESLDAGDPAHERAAELKSAADGHSASTEPASLEGSVRDSQGNGISGAWVNIELNGQRGGTQPAVVTDSEGRWRLNALEPGTLLLEVEARACGFAGARAEPRIRLVAGRNERVDLVLRDAPGFCGRVLDARSNRPVVEAGVLLMDAPAIWPNARVATDREGRFRLAGGGEPRARVIVEKENYAHEIAEWEASSAEHEVRLQPADANVGGIVLLPDGSPAENAYVNISCAQGAFAYMATDKAGRFRLVSLPSGPARVFAFLSQGRERKSSWSVLRELEVQPSENELRLELERPAGARLGGAVTREAALAAGVRLVVTQQAPAGMLNGNLNTWVIYTGDDGRYDLHDLLPVHYLVEFDSLDGSVGLPARYSLDLASGEAVETLDFRAVPGIFFAGKVLTPFARGALTLELWAQDGTAPISRTSLSERDQSFHLGLLPPALYRLRLMDRDRPATELTLGPETRNGIELLPPR